MRLLLDTHAWLWFRMSSPRLGAAARAALLHPANDVVVSVVSAWEVGIKAHIGKLTLPDPFESWLDPALAAFDVLPITLDHVRIASTLPPHHKDPFDRMLVAQTRAEALTFVSADPQIALYGVPLLQAEV